MSLQPHCMCICSMRVWHYNHGEGWPDAETDLRNGWSAMDFSGRRHVLKSLIRHECLFSQDAPLSAFAMTV